MKNKNRSAGSALQTMTAKELLKESPSPAELVRRIGAGESAAETLLVARYQRPLLELLRHRSRDIELAHDLLQDTLVIVIKRLRERGLDDPDRLVAFIHRIAHNLVIAHFRKESRRATYSDTDTVEIRADEAPTSLDTVLSEERGAMVRRLLEELNQDRDRELLRRFYVWGHEKDLVCEAMGMNGAQFDRIVSRARHRFRALVEKSLGEQP